METKLEKMQYIVDMYNKGVIRSPEAMHEIGETLEDWITVKESNEKTSKDIKVKINIDADKTMEEIREVAKDIIKKHIKIEF
ncbi:hypothetical protein ACTQ4K_00145 [Clostridium sporogenes]|uniref:hypothetical protein n=1 Tax=Clostridium sporogenes TaxID=1509 RepID=UPI003F937D73